MAIDPLILFFLKKCCFFSLKIALLEMIIMATFQLLSPLPPLFFLKISSLEMLIAKSKSVLMYAAKQYNKVLHKSLRKMSKFNLDFDHFTKKREKNI